MAAPNRAPEIPNLLSLRPPGASRGRGPRRRGGPPRASGPPHATYSFHSPTHLSSTVSQAERDRLIQETDSDANVSRLSAVVTGCLEDPFAGEFGACAPHSVSTIRQPIINRGKSSYDSAFSSASIVIEEHSSPISIRHIRPHHRH